MARDFAKQFYSSKTWQACRNEYAKRRQYLCENCLRRGIYRPGEIVHHKIHIDAVNIEKPEITLNPNNLELLCRNCHADMHEAKARNNFIKINKRKREAREKKNRYKVDEFGRVFSREPPL